MNKNSDSNTGNKNGNNDGNGGSNNGYLNSEEENAFLQMEMEMEMEREKGKENEKDDEIDENENNNESNSDSVIISNPDDTEFSTQVGRNGMEFSLFLDESSDADLYLVLQSGVEKEDKYVNNEIASNILSIDQNDSIKVKIELNEMQLKSGKKYK